MIHHYQRKQQSIKRAFTLAWFIFTALCLTSLFFYQKQQYDEQQFVKASKPLKTTLPIDFEKKIFFLKETALMSGLLLLSFLLYFYIRKLLIERASFKTAMEVALQQNKFKPVYLPTWEEAKQNYTGAEVLLRWYDKEIILLPDLFIMEAEMSGLIVPMTLKILETALQDSHLFLKRHPDFHLAFNLTMHHFKDPVFFTKLYTLFNHYQINASQIMFEITERALLNPLDEQLTTSLKELIQRGFSLAIDDFGTGHSSINYLRHFPFTHLKIDQIFIQAIGTGAITETLSYSIIQLANAIKLRIIAEGVETAEQYDYLKKNKVNYMQGWYFSKALPFTELIDFINLGKQ